MFRKILVLSLLIASLVVFAGPWLTQAGLTDHGAGAPAAHPAPGYALQLPPFLSVAYGAPKQQGAIADYFADGVAGITAYTNVGKGINIDKLATSDVFQTIEDSQPGEYVIGTVVPTGFKDSKTVNEIMQVHVFAQREGWIVAYLTPEQPTARIIDWSKYDEKKLSTTTLEDGLLQVAKVASVTPAQIGYFHFNYPEATNLMLVGDTIRKGNPNWDAFTVKIPTALTLYESSFSHSGLDNYKRKKQCWANGSLLGELYPEGDWRIKIDTIDIGKWQSDSPNKVELYGEIYENYGNSNCAVAFVYGEAE